ncbi:MAG: hypothetical protein KIPDCIKN_02466 [Haliscomenobacter sp.]|jgi:hypothetical protein|nr:hypothetical protein [Haliscomenobacter sp.]
MPLIETPLSSSEPFYSVHAFLFPFEWTYRNNNSPLLEDQTDLSRIEVLMQQRGPNWERRASWVNPQSLVQYNEVTYFYDFVRPVLYDTGTEDSLQRHYYYKLPGAEHDNEYVIELANGKTYRLEIDDIVVSFFNTGVGYMAFSLYNRRKEQSAPQDILKINAFGRRVYPPFLSANLDLIGQQAFFDDQDWARGLKGTQEISNEMARSIRLETNGVAWALEDFQSWLVDQNPQRPPALVRQLLPEAMLQETALSPVLDDRMFTVCWYGNKELTEYLKGQNPEEHYKTDDWWYRFVFVDTNFATCPNMKLRKKLLEEATNPRWVNSGTFYGISRYSFVALTEHFSAGFFAKIIASHVQTMYYKTALLALMQRACLMRFSQEVTAISQLPKRDRRIAARVSSLYKQYLRFVNKIYFREVTAQEQGIEHYDILQNQMRLDKHVKDLELEIQELHQYVSMLEEEQRNDKLDILTYIGAFFVVPSFIATYFGIDGYEMNGHWWEISLLGFLSAAFAFGVVRVSGAWRTLFVVLLVLLMTFTLFIYPKLVF